MQENNLRILAGPIIRKITPNQVTIWLVSSVPVKIELALCYHDSKLRFDLSQQRAIHSIKVAEHYHVHLINLGLEQALPYDCLIQYQLKFFHGSTDSPSYLTDLIPDICYPQQTKPAFVIHSQVKKILHGSCRKPHFELKADSSDGLVIADQFLQQQLTKPEDWPSLLIMSGDQIYADDVATPMLVATHQICNQLGFSEETFAASKVSNSTDLHTGQAFYNNREAILPADKESTQIKISLFEGVKKPIFTSDNAHNHLISAAEVMSMYLLSWSPEAWELTDQSMPSGLSAAEKIQYHKQLQAIECFKKGLPNVRRLLAHMPTAMMFDDHDVTDDWNLTAAWQTNSQQHDFSRRILGNALIGYLICQGWGNEPAKIPEQLLTLSQQSFDDLGSQAHQELINQVFKFEQWHYEWQTKPKLIVLDTRTQRWWSESNPNKPSGLMDWEAITDLQQNLIGEQAVILVSPAPIFGVKLIESVQKIFTWFGKPLMVDAENWMAHNGSANSILNLFCHPKTPQNFVILSGDVHYSFVSKISIKRRKNSPDIWQITSSGLRNQFPKQLLNWLDRLNRWVYAPWSPLNAFTKRRKMRVSPLKPSTASAGERLVNESGIGLVELDSEGRPSRITQLTQTSQIEFLEDKINQE
ncbi:hypothetical protein [Catenovulum maritimum]|uniref:Isoleucyl-tRNA synthetase n=1 Tax=Catenovulum maritimum TaxID=1513271 RepID=A0A0J8GYR9_9ALTE|nr:hypothetical protein [Catenovulum maritimum]KMT65878.1 isoleucyl-tRNA synthetase [Catenovulum maritimum]